jgi:hypothetical protein
VADAEPTPGVDLRERIQAVTWQHYGRRVLPVVRDGQAAYRATCQCGWKGAPVATREAADAAHSNHLAEAVADLLPAHRRQIAAELRRRANDVPWSDPTLKRGIQYAAAAVEASARESAVPAPATGPAPSLTAQDALVVPEEADEGYEPFVASEGFTEEVTFVVARAVDEPVAVPGIGDEPPPGWESVAALQQAYDEMAALYQASVAQRAAEPRDPAADAAESATWEAMRLLLAKVEGERDEARAELGALQRHFALANDSAIDNGDWLQDAREELTALNDQLWHALDIDPETSPSLADMVDMLVGQTGELGEECERLRVERDRLAAAVERVRALAQRWVDTGTTAGAGVLASAVFHALDEQPEVTDGRN